MLSENVICIMKEMGVRILLFTTPKLPEKFNIKNTIWQNLLRQY